MKKVLLLLLVSLISNSIFSQKLDVDYAQFVTETQYSGSEVGEIFIAWWVPVEFWQITFQNDNSLTQPQIDEFVTILSKYTLFAVVDGKVGPNALVTYQSYEDIKASIELIDLNNTRYKPLDNNLLNPDMQNLLSAFKPALKNMMGELGENMNFYVFSDVNDKGERISDPRAEGFVQLSFDNREHKWRTPLSSLIRAKICPTDSEEMSGAWSYCPWHGKKLKEK